MSPSESPPPPPASGERVLIVDDAPANLDLLGRLLEEQGYQVLAAPGGEAALRVAERAGPDLVLLDILMPGLDGYEICRRLRAHPATRHIPVLFISARDQTQSLVEAFQAGGVDYITKPFHAEEVLVRVETHLQIGRLTRQLLRKNQELERRGEELLAANDALRREARKRHEAEDALRAAGEQLSLLTDREVERWGLAAFVGKSPTFAAILQDIRRLHNFGSVNVLITGESGTGKELIARALHFGGTRAKRPFVPVNCVAVPGDLAESVFFGHVRGAFTGATMDKKGYFELADGGTLFLDEIGDMPAGLQAKLLRVLEDGEVTAVGATRAHRVDVRVVAATNADLAARIEAGAFRRDLYFRLAQFIVEAPPLRQRPEDVALLAAHFLRVFATEMGLATPPLSAEALAALEGHDYPGNVRELKNVIERALIESGGGEIMPEHLRLTAMRPTTRATMTASRPAAAGPAAAGTPAAPPAGGAADLPLNLEKAEELLIRRALAETGGNVAEAARRLGVNRTRIYRRLGGG